MIICSFSKSSQGQKTRADNHIFFIDSINRFNTIEDILSLPKFKNKTVYIDLWGTTCIPCIREFSNVKPLHERYAGKAIEFVYICYNYHADVNDEWRKRWKKMVIDHDLAGTNLYVYVLPPNKLVHKTIDKYFEASLPANTSSSYGIPMYFIAKKGKILVYDAKRPGDQLGQVVNQIDSVKALQN